MNSTKTQNIKRMTGNSAELCVYFAQRTLRLGLISNYSCI